MANPFFRPATRKDDNTTEAFPLPPPFYKSFTTNNQSTFNSTAKTLRAQHDFPAQSSADPAMISERLIRDQALREALSADVQRLIPPAPPSDGKWRCFGEEYDVNTAHPISSSSSTATSNVKAVALDLDPRQTLLVGSRKALLHFLRLVALMSANPEQAAPEIEKIRGFLRDTYEAANQYRPHQARETLIEMMERQVERGQNEIKKVKEMEAKVDELIAGLRDEEELGNKEIEGPLDQGDEVWRALETVTLEGL